MPLMVAVPFLFAAASAFGYFVVLPAAVHFLANFNASEFNVLVQASPLLQLRGHDPARDGGHLPGPGASSSAPRAWARDAAAAAPGPPLRDRGLRGASRPSCPAT